MVRAVVCDVSSLLDGGLAEQPVVVQTYLLGFHLDGYYKRSTQRAQYPLIKEYSLNHHMKPYII